MTTAPTKTPKSKQMRAGGRATEAGMAFQAAVATWFAVHILARLPVGGRFGINTTALPVAIRLETGTGLDDIEVSQSDGGALHVQNKTSATLSTGDKAPLAKTGAQLADWMSEAKASGAAPDPTRNAAVLAVRANAARTLDDQTRVAPRFAGPFINADLIQRDEMRDPSMEASYEAARARGYASVALGTLIGPSGAGFVCDTRHSDPLPIMAGASANLVAAAITFYAARQAPVSAVNRQRSQGARRR